MIQELKIQKSFTNKINYRIRKKTSAFMNDSLAYCSFPKTECKTNSPSIIQKKNLKFAL